MRHVRAAQSRPATCAPGHTDCFTAAHLQVFTMAQVQILCGCARAVLLALAPLLCVVQLSCHFVAPEDSCLAVLSSWCFTARMPSSYHSVITRVADWPCVQRQQRFQGEAWSHAFSLSHIPPALVLNARYLAYSAGALARAQALLNNVLQNAYVGSAFTSALCCSLKEEPGVVPVHFFNNGKYCAGQGFRGLAQVPAHT